MGGVVIGRSPGRTGRPAFSLREAAVSAVMVRSEVDPLPPMSCRYFGQSAALAATPAADNAAVASTAATIPLMKRDRCCFILPPEVRQPAVVVNGLAQALGKPGRRPPAEHLISLPAVEGEPADVTGAPLTAMWFDRHAEQLAHPRSEEHTSELQSQSNLVCRLLLEKKKKNHRQSYHHHHTQPRPYESPQSRTRAVRGYPSPYDCHKLRLVNEQNYPTPRYQAYMPR